jgi:hypothetical protein
MAKMRRFDNGGSVSEKPQSVRYDDRGRVIPLYGEDSGVVAQRASQAAPSYSTTQTPSDHFTNLPSGSAAQVNAMRNTVGLPATDEAANKEKATDMMRSIVGLNPNTNNYSLQDAISQLKGQYKAPGGMQNANLQSALQGMGAMGNAGPGMQSMGSIGAPLGASIKGGQGMGIAGMQAPTAPPPEVPMPQDQMMAEGQGGFKHGGKIKAYAKGGSTGRDGIAQRGKTKAFAKGGSVSASSRGDGCAQRGKTRGMMR